MKKGLIFLKKIAILRVYKGDPLQKYFGKGVFGMDLKKIFPLSFKYVGSGKNLLIGILVYLLVGVLAGLAIWVAGLLTGWIPVVGALIGWILRIAGILVDVYVVAGIIVQLLKHFKAI